jgi:hypothetical protein
MHRPPTTHDLRARRLDLIRAVLLGLALLLAVPLSAAAADGDPTPTPTPTVDPTPTPTPDPTPTPTPSPSPGPSLPPVTQFLTYHNGSVVRQYAGSWCVAAATQTMWNLVGGTTNATYARQKTLYHQIRLHNRYHYRSLGNDVQGWAWALRRYTGFAYTARFYASKDRAIGEIAAALDRTGHPVGITIHHGRHAWVVLGYRSQPDALDPTKRTVLGFYVNGPLGAGSSDPWRYQYLSMAAFRKVYGKYHESQRKVIWENRYVLVTD